MQITLTEAVHFEAKFLRASCGVRYWDDAQVDGVPDDAGDLIPCRNGNNWEPLIDLESGIIQNWQLGKMASIHYKVCDDGRYAILDENMTCLREIDSYVPSIMCPEGNGFGDYVIMNVDVDGRIANWRPDLDIFTRTK
jgi:hypothetical protein